MCFTDVWGMFIGASTANTALRTDRWKTEKLASAELFRVKSWPAEGSGSSGLGSKELKGFFVVGEHSKCSVLTAWQSLRPLPKSCRSLERNLEDANKNPQNTKNPASLLCFWMHLLSQLCCFGPVPQAVQGLTLVLVQLSRKQKKLLLFLLVLKHNVLPWRREEINNSGTRKIKTSKWSQSPKSLQNTLISYFLFSLACDFFSFLILATSMSVKSKCLFKGNIYSSIFFRVIYSKIRKESLLSVWLKAVQQW